MSGADGDDFEFDSFDKLIFKAGHEPDFEDRSSYSITVEAHSGEGPRRLSASLDVIIDVVDGEDAGAVLLSQRQPEVGIAIQAVVSDDDGGVTIRKWVWEWSVEVTRNGDLPECQDESGPLWTDSRSNVGGLRPEGGRRGQVPAGDGDLHRQHT